MTIIKFFSEQEDGSHPVRIGLVPIGTVVEETTFVDGVQKVPAGRFGHVVGFARNCTGELLLRVRWEYPYTAPSQVGMTEPDREIHPGNLIYHG